MKRATTIKQDSYGPFTQSYAITPHATNPVGDIEYTALLVGGAGNIAGRLVGDDTDRTFAVPAGVLPLVFEYVRVTGTTATNLFALY